MTSLADWPPTNLRGWLDAYHGDVLHAALAYAAEQYRLDRNSYVTTTTSQLSCDREFMNGIARGKEGDRQGAWAYVTDAFHCFVNLLGPDDLAADPARERVEQTFQQYALELDDFTVECARRARGATVVPLHEWIRQLDHPAVETPEAARARVLRDHPAPLNHPLDRLRHTIALLPGRPDDDLILEATGVGVYPEQPVTGDRTGLTMGDLRALWELASAQDKRLRAIGVLVTEQQGHLAWLAEHLKAVGITVEMVD